VGDVEPAVVNKLRRLTAAVNKTAARTDAKPTQLDELVPKRDVLHITDVSHTSMKSSTALKSNAVAPKHLRGRRFEVADAQTIDPFILDRANEERANHDAPFTE
jgi:hypothetical protein